jgi:hypothetical protein
VFAIDQCHLRTETDQRAREDETEGGDLFEVDVVVEGEVPTEVLVVEGAEDSGEEDETGDDSEGAAGGRR